MDSNISICNVKNKENGEDLTLYTEWTDIKLKMVIVKADNILEGEVLKENFNNNAKIFEKSITDFLKETQDILAGKVNDIDFVLKSDKFFWKRTKWSLGEIVIKPLTEIKHASSILLKVMNKFSQNLKYLADAEENHRNDEIIISELRESNSDMVKKKEQSDIEWCKRAILILNSKKEKIRNLKKALEKYETKKDPIFDADTQNSEDEEETTERSDIRCKRNLKKNDLECDAEVVRKNKTCDISVQTEAHPSNAETKQRNCKRKSIDSDDEKPTKKKKCDVFVQTEHLESPTEEKEVFASSSKSLQMSSNIGEDEDTPDLLTDESECEVELKFEDDKIQDTEIQENLMTREESSEELF